MTLPVHLVRTVAAVLAVVTMLAFVAMTARAGEAPAMVADPRLESRVQKIAEELRCLVCQNQTIADSHAALAIDLKNSVREQLRQGRSDREVLDYMVARYGEFILYRPPLRPGTWVLWIGPFVLMTGGLWFLVVALKRRARRLAELERAPDVVAEVP